MEALQKASLAYWDTTLAPASVANYMKSCLLERDTGSRDDEENVMQNAA
jgi:hypothetical protein